MPRKEIHKRTPCFMRNPDAGFPPRDPFKSGKNCYCQKPHEYPGLKRTSKNYREHGKNKEQGEENHQQQPPTGPTTPAQVTPVPGPTGPPGPQGPPGPAAPVQTLSTPAPVTKVVTKVVVKRVKTRAGTVKKVRHVRAVPVAAPTALAKTGFNVVPLLVLGGLCLGGSAFFFWRARAR